jgi:putative two-component system hydrogenase maturation factor HypX/HoxX
VSAAARRLPARAIPTHPSDRADGRRDFFSTGIHLTVIESAADPAAESWRNLNAITDLVHDVITTDTHLVVSALCGDVAAGGVALALAADRVVARKGIVINPYYQHMGGLYGSEYWTYLFPRRVGHAAAARLTSEPFAAISSAHAARIGLLDGMYGPTVESFTASLHADARRLADPLPVRRAARSQTRAGTRPRDETASPLPPPRDGPLAPVLLRPRPAIPPSPAPVRIQAKPATEPSGNVRGRLQGVMASLATCQRLRDLARSAHRDCRAGF